MAFARDDALQDACVLSAWCQIKQMQCYSIDRMTEIVISHLSKMFLSCLCGRVHEQRQFNLSAEIKETKCQIYEAKHFHFKLFFFCKSNLAGIYQTL